MALRLEDHVFRVLENQDALYTLLGEHRWDFDMDKGAVIFSTTRGSGGLLGRFFSESPRVIATCPVQLIGSESERDNTWLWAWANEKSEIPPYLTRGVMQIRDEARDGGLSLLFDPNPIPLPNPRFGTELAIICTGHLGLFTYYACPHSGGVFHLAIVDPPEGIEIERTAMQATRIMHIGMTALEFNHKVAIVAYLGEPARREGEALEWDIVETPLRIEFDEQGRIARMTTSAGGRREMKDPLVRFSVAIGGELLQKFDQYRETHRYPNRSEAVRGLMRAALIEDVITHDESEAMGVVTLIYDHHAGRIAERLTEIQHLHLERVVTTTHVHLDARRCLEVILLRGSAKLIRELADSLIGTKGVESGRLVLTAASPLPDRYEGPHHRHPHDHDHGGAHHHH